MNKSTIFSNAWTIARNATSSFGGSVKSYFAESLKMAYAALKAPAQTIEEKLIAMGGNRWTKNNMDRIYFNSGVIAKMVDLQISSYKTGNISSATFCGEKISNSRAAKLIRALSFCKFWFDVKTAEFCIKDLDVCAVDFNDIEAGFRKAL